MSAVAELSKPDTAVLFTAARADLRLVKKPRRPIWGPDGEQIDLKPGQAFKFSEGTYRLTAETTRLEDGGEIGSAEALAWFRSHRLYGNRHEGFVEVMQAPPQVSREEMDMILEAAVDPVRLREIIAAEEAGWNRDDLLVPARKQLDRAAAVMEPPKPAPKRR